MKGCLDSIFKLIVFFVVFFICTGSITSFILPDAPSFLAKDRSLLTRNEIIESNKFHTEIRVRMSESTFYSFPPAFLTMYLIFRKKKKG